MCCSSSVLLAEVATIGGGLVVNYLLRFGILTAGIVSPFRRCYICVPRYASVGCDFYEVFFSLFLSYSVLFLEVNLASRGQYSPRHGP